MRLGIVGSRRRNSEEDKQLIRERIIALKPTMIISGGCEKGADKFAEELAKELGIPIKIYHPKIDKNVKDYNYWDYVNANYARNQLIALDAEYLIALVAPDRKGGTESTIRYFKNCKLFTSVTSERCLEIL